VLYDDVLDKQVGNLTKKVIGDSNSNNIKLTYRDINGRQLVLPTLVFPFRRAIYLVSHTAYSNATNTLRSHKCAEQSCPTEEQWEALRITVRGEPQDCCAALSDATG
jgi:hypothetical protein